jgi:hypothetical protein
MAYWATLQEPQGLAFGLACIVIGYWFKEAVIAEDMAKEAQQSPQEKRQ